MACALPTEENGIQLRTKQLLNNLHIAEPAANRDRIASSSANSDLASDDDTADPDYQTETEAYETDEDHEDHEDTSVQGSSSDEEDEETTESRRGADRRRNAPAQLGFRQFVCSFDNCTAVFT